MGVYDTLYRCNICGREGSVARCCSNDNRTPLNDEAKKEYAELLEKYGTSDIDAIKERNSQARKNY